MISPGVRSKEPFLYPIVLLYHTESTISQKPPSFLKIYGTMIRTISFSNEAIIANKY
tara:strand:- start:3874 stop:4044 length:171 start_codon:yes stop_codon:yes gene_type:complete